MKAARGLILALILFFATVGSLVLLNSSSDRCVKKCKAICRANYPYHGEERRKCYDKCEVKCGHIVLEDSGYLFPFPYLDGHAELVKILKAAGGVVI